MESHKCVGNSSHNRKEKNIGPVKAHLDALQQYPEEENTAGSIVSISLLFTLPSPPSEIPLW